MSLSLMRPFAGLDEMFDGLNQSFFKPYAGNWMPAVDVEESEHFFAITAELPGVGKSDVNVTVDENVLTIQGEKKTENEDQKRHRVERSYGSFTRSFTLPKGVDADQVQAHYDNGVLKVMLPKAKQTPGRQIEVKVQ